MVAPTEVDIPESVACLRKYTVRPPSLLGEETSMQDLVAGAYALLALDVRRHAIERGKLREHTAYSSSRAMKGGRYLRGVAAFLGAFCLFASAMAEQPERGGVLNAIVTPEPPSLNLALQQVGATQLVASKVYESLIEYSPALEPRPCLAKSWEVSPDRLTYTFHLQENVKWHDGQPFSSADVLFTYQKVLALTARTRTLMENVAEITVPDANTVVFRLKQPFSAFLYAFDIGGGAILPKHLYDVAVDLSKNPHNNAPIGTGPFKFARWERGSYIELTRNFDYWRPALPYLDGITYRVIPDAASRRIAIEQGEVQQALCPIDIEPYDMRKLMISPKLKIISTGTEYWSPITWIEMNNSLPPFSDKRFRQAVMYAINRDFIVNKIYFGICTVATGPLHHNTRFYEPEVKRYEFSREKAAALLDEMGLKPDKSGVRVRVAYIPQPYGEVFKRTAEYIRQSLSKVGVAVTIENTDIGGWVRRVGAGDFQMAGNTVFQYGDPAIGVARTYLSTNIRKGLMFSNTAQYRNPQVDDLFVQAASAPDSERPALYSEIQRILVEDVPVAWISDQATTAIFSVRVHDAIKTGLGTSGSYAEAWMEKP